MTAPARQGGKRYWGSALFAAAIAAWVMFFSLLGFTGLVQSLLAASSAPPIRSMSFTDGLWIAALLGAPIVLLVCFVAGVPALVFVQRMKLKRWWQWLLTGAVVGLIVLLGFLLMLGAPLVTGHLLGALAFMLTGAAAGVSAWASLWLDAQGSGKRRGTEVK